MYRWNTEVLNFPFLFGNSNFTKQININLSIEMNSCM